MNNADIGASLPAAILPMALRERISREAVLRLVVAGLVAAVLLFAAIAKSAGVWSALAAARTNADALGVEVSGALSRVAPDVALALAEVAIGLTLVWLRRRWWMWAFIAAMFSAYAAVAGSALLRGAASCGCFGPIAVPPAVTFTLDAAALVSAFTLATTGLLGRRRAAGWTLSAMALAALLGAAYARAAAPPPSALDNNPALQQTFAEALALPSMRDVASADPAGPLWLLFVYDVYCEHCAEFMPFMTSRAKQWADDPAFRVRLLSMQDAQQQAGIELWRWPSSPTIALIEQGVVVELIPSERVFDPIEVRTRVLKQ